MTYAPLSRSMEPTLPDRDTPAHWVLHSLIRNSNQRGFCDLKPSEIARLGKYESQAVVRDGLADLIDAGVAVSVETDTGNVVGHQLLARCAPDCAPARKTKRQVRRELSPNEAQPLDNSPAGRGGSRLTGSDQTARAIAGLEAELSSSLLRSNGGVYLQGSRLVKGHHGTPLDPDSPMGLALHFDWKIRYDSDDSFRQAVEPTNIGALVGKFRKWMAEDGVTYYEIRWAIDHFASGKYLGEVPPWKKFLYDRQRLIDAARRAAMNYAMEEHRLDRDYWVGPSPERDLDELRRLSYAALSPRDLAARAEVDPAARAFLNSKA